MQNLKANLIFGEAKTLFLPIRLQVDCVAFHNAVYLSCRGNKMFGNTKKRKQIIYRVEDLEKRRRSVGIMAVIVLLSLGAGLYVMFIPSDLEPVKPLFGSLPVLRVGLLVLLGLLGAYILCEEVEHSKLLRELWERRVNIDTLNQRVMELSVLHDVSAAVNSMSDMGKTANVIMSSACKLMTAEVGDLTKLDHAVAAAMGLANVALLSGDRVGLLVFSKEVRGYLPPRKGGGQFRRVVDLLARAEADLFEPDYAYALGYLASRLSRRSLVVMLTDLAAGSSSSAMVARLLALLPRHLPICATIHDPQLSRAALAEPQRPFEAFRAAAAREVLRDQAITRQVLTSRGVVTVDVEAEELLPALITRYLDIKARGRL